MSDQVAVSVQTPAAPPAVDMASFSQLLGLDDAPATKNAPAPRAEPAKPAVAGTGGDKSVVPKLKEPIDPLDEADFDEAKLSSPAAMKAARDRLVKARAAAAELTRAAHRSHGAAGTREKAVVRRETEVERREGTAAAYERAFQAGMVDLQSGDPDRFLTAIHRLGNVGDPAGFWKTVSLKLASGGTFTEAEKREAKADPEIQRRLEQLEQTLRGQNESTTQRENAEHEHRVEQLRTQNFETAAKNEATPLVMAYASDPRTAAHVKSGIAKIMTEHFAETKMPLTVAQACETLEEELKLHYELSQRADGNANREKGTTSSGLEAGRVTSQEPPKPGTSQATIPATLSTSPGGAQRPMSEDEARAEQIRQLTAAGFYGD